MGTPRHVSMRQPYDCLSTGIKASASRHVARKIEDAVSASCLAEEWQAQKFPEAILRARDEKLPQSTRNPASPLRVLTSTIQDRKYIRKTLRAMRLIGGPGPNTMGFNTELRIVGPSEHIPQSETLSRFAQKRRHGYLKMRARTMLLVDMNPKRWRVLFPRKQCFTQRKKRVLREHSFPDSDSP